MSTAGPHHYAGPADLHSLDTIHALLDTAWSHAPHLGASERARFTLIVAELVANIIEHGSHNHPTPPHLQLAIAIDNAAIHGVLTDNGAEPPQPPTNTPTDQEAQPTGQPALRESGRGLLLVRSVADTLTLTRNGEHNHWQFTVRARNAPPRTDAP
jgi:anti-sigma regulatory factor (Ser/Thr protein kinase)